MTSVFTSTVQYITENLSCLTYAGDVIVNKYLIYTSYYDLLVDISEGFGVWVSIVVLTLALLALSVAIHKEESSTTNLLLESKSAENEITPVSLLSLSTALIAKRYCP